jgi:hypothetical protein
MITGIFVIDIIFGYFNSLASAAIILPILPAPSRDRSEVFLHSNAFDLRYQVPFFGCTMITITLFSAG